MDASRPPPDILISPRGTKALLRAGVESVQQGLEPATLPEGDAVDLAAMRSGLEAALAFMEDEPERGDVMYSPDHGPSSLLQSFLAEATQEQLAELLAQGKLSEAAAGGFEVKFDNHDLGGWIKSFFTWWGRLFKKHPFIAPPAEPDAELPDGARIAVLGDWGSGRYGAPVSAATIERTDPKYDMLLHLGDVYYSGTEKEVERRFLAFWPKVQGAISRACNANHEMYSGGNGYFKRVLPTFHQSSSCFAVDSPYFVLVGLDTGYDEHDLTDSQLPWLERLVARADETGKRVVLFSHHQLFSSFETQGIKLAAKLGSLLSQRKLFAWYWGHEHRCAIFDRHPQWGLHGRLVGHSGFPYFRDELGDPRPRVKRREQVAHSNGDGSAWWRIECTDGRAPDALLLDGPNRYVPGEEARYGVQGHMTLQLVGPTIRELVHAPDGTVLHDRVIA